ncbi:MAG: hypothetical protein ACLU3U_09005 [Gallintestinimicrobium sp.]
MNLPAVDIVIAAAIDCAVQFATCVGYARTLGNLPYNLLNIEEMVAYAQAISEKYGIRFHAYREAELKGLDATQFWRSIRAAVRKQHSS